MSEKFIHSIEAVNDREIEPGEPDAGVPVIDVIRHGQTEYKELKDPGFRFDPGAEDFALDAEHLDLTEEGIASVRETAQTLEERIEKEREAVLIISSPNFRAQSTALVIDDYLRSRGISSFEGIRSSKALRQITLQEGADIDAWMTADTALRAEDERHETIPTFERFEAIATRLGKELNEIFKEDVQKIDERFNRFVRHMTNINDWLSDETKAFIQGKRLRIIAVTHEEIPGVFMQKTLGTTEHMKNAQILELRPNKNLRKGDRNSTDIELLAKGEGSQPRTGRIENQFMPQE